MATQITMLVWNKVQLGYVCSVLNAAAGSDHFMDMGYSVWDVTKNLMRADITGTKFEAALVEAAQNAGSGIIRVYTQNQGESRTDFMKRWKTAELWIDEESIK